MPRARLLLAVVAAVALAGLPTAAQPAATAAAGATYYLPAPAGTQLTVTQGQNTPSDHNATNGSQYAWDFGIAGNGEFDVTAVRAGKVIGLRDNSQANCYSDGNDMSCWKDANYALVDHGDGTSALYMHLAFGSAAAAGVKVGDTVAAGQKLAKDDNTGFSSGNHLHFMVETTPTVPNAPPPGPTDKTAVAWWWTNSQPITFSDPDVLAHDPDGIPRYGQTVASGAPVVTAPQTPAPSYGELKLQLKCNSKGGPVAVWVRYKGTPGPLNEVYLMAGTGKTSDFQGTVVTQSGPMGGSVESRTRTQPSS